MRENYFHIRIQHETPTWRDLKQVRGMVVHGNVFLMIMWPGEHQNIMANIFLGYIKFRVIVLTLFNASTSEIYSKVSERLSSDRQKVFVYIKYHHYINLWTEFFSLHEFIILRKSFGSPCGRRGRILMKFFGTKIIFVLKRSGSNESLCLIIHAWRRGRKWMSWKPGKYKFCKFCSVWHHGG